MYWDTSGARHFRESCREERRGEVSGGTEEGSSFLLVHRRQLEMSEHRLERRWLWLVMVTQNTSPGCCFVTNTQLSSQSLLQAGGGM